MVETEHQNIAQLILPGGAPIWFDVKKAEGPIRTTPFERQDGVRSAMMLAGDNNIFKLTRRSQRGN